ncbi:hypothetical protein BsWGS_25501 [Bradybaena similaris]
MSKHTEDEMAEFQETFSLFDTRGDGKIAASQLPDVLRALNQNPTEQEIRKCGFSQNPDARITFETFYPFLETISKGRTVPTLEDFIEGFRVFDKDQNGHINYADLRHVLMSLGEKMSDDEVNELLAGQEGSDGNINYEEFVKMVMNG